ncbi:MAG: class I SAM-dependent methyltransferase [Elusimicrobia bacterium]|nr:class I SAM-dependent methyltransferase [Elusimicrobiota bacterium]
MLTINRFPNTGLFASLNGMQIPEDKKKYYFKLLQNIFNGTYNLEHLNKCNCGSADLEVLSIHDRFSLPFGTLICRACGLIQLSPRLTEKDLPGFYEEIYWGLVLGENNDELSTGDSGMAIKIYDFMHKYLSESFKNKILSIIEVGCGSGVKLSEIKKQFARNGIQSNVIGCDYSENALSIARKKNIEVFQGGIESLIGKRADLVILSHVVEHFYNIKAEFEKIKGLLNKGAYVYIEVPGVCDLVNKSEYNYSYPIYSVMAHMYNFNLTSLRSVIEPLGFQFIDGSEFVRSLFLYDPSHKANVDISHNYEYTIQCLKAAENKRTMKLPLHRRIKRKFKYILNKVF